MSFYWITRLDAIVTVSVIIAILAVVALITIVAVAASECDEDEIEKVKKPAWVSFIIAVVFTLVAVFTPTTKTACAIYFVDYLQENKDARELPDKVLKSANLYFDKLIEDLDEEKKNE